MSRNKPERMVCAGLHLNPRAHEDLSMTVDVGHFAQLSLLTSARIQLDTGKRPVGSSEQCAPCTPVEATSLGIQAF